MQGAHAGEFLFQQGDFDPNWAPLGTLSQQQLAKHRQVVAQHRNTQPNPLRLARAQQPAPVGPAAAPSTQFPPVHGGVRLRQRAPVGQAVQSTQFQQVQGHERKKRGNYKCRRCGQLKRGHICAAVTFVDTVEKGVNTSDWTGHQTPQSMFKNAQREGRVLTVSASGKKQGSSRSSRSPALQRKPKQG